MPIVTGAKQQSGKRSTRLPRLPRASSAAFQQRRSGLLLMASWCAGGAERTQRQEQLVDCGWTTTYPPPPRAPHHRQQGGPRGAMSKLGLARESSNGDVAPPAACPRPRLPPPPYRPPPAPPLACPTVCVVEADGNTFDTLMGILLGKVPAGAAATPPHGVDAGPLPG